MREVVVKQERLGGPPVVASPEINHSESNMFDEREERSPVDFDVESKLNLLITAVVLLLRERERENRARERKAGQLKPEVEADRVWRQLGRRSSPASDLAWIEWSPTAHERSAAVVYCEKHAPALPVAAREKRVIASASV